LEGTHYTLEKQEGEKCGEFVGWGKKIAGVPFFVKSAFFPCFSG
jgi:hypothetical protein